MGISCFVNILFAASCLNRARHGLELLKIGIITWIHFISHDGGALLLCSLLDYSTDAKLSTTAEKISDTH
jgi:hypothetical protein